MCSYKNNVLKGFFKPIQCGSGIVICIVFLVEALLEIQCGRWMRNRILPCYGLTVGGKLANLDRIDTSSSGDLRSHFLESPHPGGVAHRFSKVSVRIQDRFLDKNSVPSI